MDNRLYLGLFASMAVFAPLLSAIICGLGSLKLSNRACHLVAISLLGLTFLASGLVWVGFKSEVPIIINLYTWGLNIKFGLWLDKLSISMMLIVSFISWIVHIYTMGYMQGDPGYNRFFSYIGLFTFAMLTLVLAPNWVQIFFGWEGVGLVSYLLIGFWFKKPSANFASLKAFIINRVGDLFFVLGIALAYKLTNSLDYTTFFANLPRISQHNLNLLGIFFLLGAMAKSAQIPFHVWLPDSMEGPTPISALIHAATMVTAGIFLLARLHELIALSPMTREIILIISGLTCLLMALLAIFEFDIKRIIAYSTLSQLGYMMLAIGAGVSGVAIFHLINHAFFKALLFLGAGSVIIAMHHEQDIRSMGNLYKKLPITHVSMLIASLSMAGVPFFSGFYSKELIIESLGHSNNLFAYFCGLITIFFTTLYSFRLLWLVFYQPKNNNHDIHEPGLIITGPLMILAVFSVFSGIILYPHHGAISFGWHGFFSVPFLLILAGIATGITVYIYGYRLNLGKFQRIFAEKYYFDYFNQNIILPLARGLGNFGFKIIDKNIIDNSLIGGSTKGLYSVGKYLRILQTGYLYDYAFSMIFGLLIFIIWLAVAY